MNVRVDDDAINDIAEIRGWLRERSALQEAAFLSELERAIDQLRAHPRSGTHYIGGTRKLLIADRHYLVVHTVDEEAVLIVAVAHTSRKPGFWLERD